MRFLFFSFLYLFSSSFIRAQSNSDPGFKVVYINILDSGEVYHSQWGSETVKNRQMIVKIYSEVAFSYPAVHAVTNKNGDTLAVGGSSGRYMHNPKLNEDYRIGCSDFRLKEFDTLLVHFGSFSKTYMILEYVVPKVEKAPNSERCPIYLWAYFKRDGEYLDHKRIAELNISIIVNAYGGRESCKVNLEPAKVVEAGTNKEIIVDSLFRLRCDAPLFQGFPSTQYELEVYHMFSVESLIIKAEGYHRDCLGEENDTQMYSPMLIDLDKGLLGMGSGGHEYSGGYTIKNGVLEYSMGMDPNKINPGKGTTGGEKKK